MFRKRKQSREYGWSDTIHRNGEVNVETDDNGVVVAVWFRCQPLPFTQSNHGEQRAADMRRMYERPMPQILAISLEDPA